MLLFTCVLRPFPSRSEVEAWLCRGQGGGRSTVAGNGGNTIALLSLILSVLWSIKEHGACDQHARGLLASVVDPNY